MAVIDIFSYNGERDMLKIHLSILDPFVDRFIIVEAKTTFTMQPKPLYFFTEMRYFKRWWPKIHYHVIDENYTDEEWDVARNSPNTQGASHWKHEFLQKESIHKALKAARVQDEDLCFIGDVDEIWQADPKGDDIETPAKLKLDVYAYYLNNRSNEQFWGTYMATYSQFKDKCLNHERSRTDIRTKDTHGWHFTSMGGLKEVQRKLNSSYTTESYNTIETQALLPERHKHGYDYLGRDFIFTRDESNWPQYLKDNKNQYKHLLFKEETI